MAELRAGFQVIRREASCKKLAGSLPEVEARSVVIAQPTDSAVVLGSAQKMSDLQQQLCESAGYGVVHRKSGGGGVIIVPNEIVWIDLFLPGDDPLYIRDVRKGSFWVGDLWADALGNLGLDPRVLSVHRGGMVESPWSSLCCFAGTGPGEVIYQGQKIMGLSQRRTRAGAWFFTLVYRSFQPDRDASLLIEEVQSRPVVADALRGQVAVVDLGSEEIEHGLLGALDRLG